MAQTVIESKDSRSLSNNGGKYVGTAVFHVWDDASEITTADEINFGVGGMPDVGTKFPGNNELTAASFSAEVVPESRGVWKVTWTYTSGDAENNKVPSEVGYLQVSMEYGGTFKDMWRADAPGARLAFQGGNPTGKDIGGKPIDAAGTPTSVFIPQHRLVVEETVSGSELVARTALSRAAVAKRNLSPFYGAAAGTLLYEGCSARRVSLTAWTLTHKFIYDDWYHMGQQARMNSQREPSLSMSEQPFAEHVRWIQPFPYLFDMNAISDNF